MTPRVRQLNRLAVDGAESLKWLASGVAREFEFSLQSAAADGQPVAAAVQS